MTVLRGKTVNNIARAASVKIAEVSMQPLSQGATDKERIAARESLRKRCPYLMTFEQIVDTVLKYKPKKLTKRTVRRKTSKIRN